MGLANYSELKQEIVRHLDQSDLADNVDTFIDLAEARHKRDIRIRQMITRGSITIDERYEDIPTGFLEGISLRLLTSPVTPVRFISIDQMASYRREESGKPQFVTVGAQLEFDRAPDAYYSGELMYYKALTALSDTATSNDLLVRAPDAYLYGALLATAPYLLNDERLEIWSSLYKSAVDGLALARRQERSIGPLVSRVYGATP